MKYHYLFLFLMLNSSFLFSQESCVVEQLFDNLKDSIVQNLREYDKENINYPFSYLKHYYNGLDERDISTEIDTLQYLDIKCDSLSHISIIDVVSYHNYFRSTYYVLYGKDGRYVILNKHYKSISLILDKKSKRDYLTNVVEYIYPYLPDGMGDGLLILGTYSPDYNSYDIEFSLDFHIGMMNLFFEIEELLIEFNGVESE